MDVPDIRTFFRHCPSCGRRFEIRLVGKEQVDEREHVDERSRLGSLPSMTVRGANLRPIVVQESSPVTVDVEAFQYTYKCRHCGHEWSEVHEKSEAGANPAAYTGD